MKKISKTFETHDRWGNSRARVLKASSILKVGRLSPDTCRWM